MKITEIAVFGLFELFDHVIPLHWETGATIIVGPNGFGKTTMLRLVAALSRFDLFFLAMTPFARLRITYDAGEVLEVRRSAETAPYADPNRPAAVEDDDPEPEIEAGKGVRVQFVHYRQDREVRKWDPVLPDLSGVAGVSLISRLLPELQERGHNSWYDRRTDETLSVQQVIRRYRTELAARYGGGSASGFSRIPRWLLTLVQDLNVRYLETRHLEHPTGLAGWLAFAAGESVPAVALAAEDLGKRLRLIRSERDRWAEELDRSYPARYLQRLQQPPYPLDEISRRLQDLEANWERLDRAGMLPLPTPPAEALPLQLPAAAQAALSLYLDDEASKQRIMAEVLENVELLLQLMNRRLLFKTLQIDCEQGFSVYSQAGKPIPLAGLSSGEQHQLLLFYELLFRIPQDAVVMIDEPELSLHIAWQREFLADVRSIAVDKGFHVLIATHSYSIVDDNWEMTVELAGEAD